MAVTQSFFPEIRKQVLADSRRRQSREASGGGTTDLVSPRKLDFSPSQKKEDSHGGDFIVDEPSPIDSVGFLLDGEARSLNPSTSSHRIKAAAVAMAAGPQAQDSTPESVKVIDSGNQVTHDQPQQCEGMVLIASLLCSCLRNVKLPQARRGTIQLLKESSLYIDDDARLQHVIPYVVALLSDNAAIVRCAALQTLCDVLSLVQVFSLFLVLVRCSWYLLFLVDCVEHWVWL